MKCKRKWLTNLPKEQLINWHWPVIPLYSFHFPSSYLSDHSDPLKIFSILFNCKLPVEMYNIIINICLEICKKRVPKKSSRKHQIPRDRRAGYVEKIIKIAKENTESNKSSNQRKCTKSEWINWKQLNIFNRYSKKSKRNKSCCWYQAKPQILLQICKKQLNDKSYNWTSPGRREGTWNQSNKKMSELPNEQYNSVFSTPDPPMSIKYTNDFFRHPQANTLSDINITWEDVIDAI